MFSSKQQGSAQHLLSADAALITGLEGAEVGADGVGVILFGLDGAEDAAPRAEKKHSEVQGTESNARACVLCSTATGPWQARRVHLHPVTRLTSEWSQQMSCTYLLATECRARHGRVGVVELADELLQLQVAGLRHRQRSKNCWHAACVDLGSLAIRAICAKCTDLHSLACALGA